MSFVQDAWDSVRGKNALERAEDAQLAANADEIARTEAATNQALSRYEPFNALLAQMPELIQYMMDPNQQIAELQQNPLFAMSLDNLNQQTKNAAAAKGRFTAGDTYQEIANNTLRAANPLLTQRLNTVANLINLGQGTAGQMANIDIGQGNQIGRLMGNVGNIQAAQDIGTMNNTNALLSQIIRAGASMVNPGAAVAPTGGAGMSGMMFSDNRLKENITPLGYSESGYEVYEWDWNDEAKKKFGLSGRTYGVLYNDVAASNPDAVTQQQGYGVVNYEKIGVQHGG